MSEAFIKRNVQLSLEFDDYLAKHPQLFASIPHGAYIVITLDDDTAFSTESLSLIKDKRRKRIVEAHRSGSTWDVRPLGESPSFAKVDIDSRGVNLEESVHLSPKTKERYAKEIREFEAVRTQGKVKTYTSTDDFVQDLLSDEVN